MPAEALPDTPGADIAGHDHQTSGEGDGQSAAAQPGGSGRKFGGRKIAQGQPVAGQKPQIEQTEDGGRHVGDGTGDRLEQQPGADGCPGQRQDHRRQFRWPTGLHSSPLRCDQEQLARHQGCFGGRPHSLELRHPEELQQAQMHDHPHGCGEPPAAKDHYQGAKCTNGKATDQALAWIVGPG